MEHDPERLNRAQKRHGTGFRGLGRAWLRGRSRPRSAFGALAAEATRERAEVTAGSPLLGA